MTTIQLENGRQVRFEGNPTPQDIEFVAKSLGSGGQAQSTADRPGIIQRASDFVVEKNLPGAELGQAIGRSVRGFGALARGDTKTADALADQNAQRFGRVIGDTARSAALPVSLAVAAPTSLVRAGAQYAGLGALSAGGEAASRGASAREVARSSAVGSAVSGVTGGVFNLAGRGISSLARKTGPSILSFTSGAPKAAIQKAAQNAPVAKQGLSTSVGEVRKQAVQSLRSLQKTLGDEFAQGLDEVKSATGQTKTGMTFNQKGFLQSSNKVRSRLTEYGRDFAREFRLGTKATPEGVAINFGKSPIVKAGEQRVVQEVFNTISTWDDFSARGMQDLAERIGALRNFESGARSESSLIVSKIYNKLAGTGGQKGLIPELYPDLAKLRTNFAKNKRVLDEIDSVLNASKDDPVAIQSSISRLDNIFKENKDEYVRAIQELGKRSGVDFETMLAGGEFQKVLPDFIRGLGGGGALGVGAAVLNPYLILLAPLFSPRFVGKIARNAPSAARTAARLFRSGATQATGQIVPRTLPPTEPSQTR